jgi:DUF1680 family protein
MVLSFWCCYGTAIESFSKLGDSIYFHNDSTNDHELWVVQFVSSVVRWREAGINVTQEAKLSYSDTAVSHTVKITIGTLSAARANATTASTKINLRIPGWALPATTTISLNGELLVKPGGAKPGTFLQIRAEFKLGDTISASFGMGASFRLLNDNRTAYDSMGSISYGPYTLAALTDGDYALQADLTKIGSWLKLTPIVSNGRKMLRFTATGADGKTMTLLPLNRIVDQVILLTRAFQLELSCKVHC